MCECWNRKVCGTPVKELWSDYSHLLLHHVNCLPVVDRSPRPHLHFTDLTGLKAGALNLVADFQTESNIKENTMM